MSTYRSTLKPTCCSRFTNVLPTNEKVQHKQKLSLLLFPMIISERFDLLTLNKLYFVNFLRAVLYLFLTDVAVVDFFVLLNCLE